MARGCWARSLGDCGGGISHEHSLSQCVYPDQTVMVSGFGFCKSEPKELHINSLTAKILCKDHNTRLGQDVDHVGGELFKAIRAFAERRRQESEFPRTNWLPVHYQVNARLLERWFLKVMLGIGFGGELIIGPGQHEAGIVPQQLARIAFGLEEFPSGEGMYVAFKDKETFQLEDRFRYTAKSVDSNILMGYFLIHGFRFYLNLERTGGPIYGNIEDSQVFYRQAHFVDSSVDLASPLSSAISSLIRKPNSFNQKLSIS
jgi:hypothetical protein